MRDYRTEKPDFSATGTVGAAKPGATGLTLGMLAKMAFAVVVFFGVIHLVTTDAGNPADHALDKAVVAGDLAAARAALASGANVRQTDMTGGTLLHTAAWRGDLAMARLLMEHGANVNHADSRTGETPLHSAARGGQAAMVTLLLSHGADANVRTFAENPQCDGHTYPSGVSAQDIGRIAGHRAVVDQLLGR